MDTVVPDDDRDQTGPEPEHADEAPSRALEAAWARYQRALADLDRRRVESD